MFVFLGEQDEISSFFSLFFPLICEIMVGKMFPQVVSIDDLCTAPMAR